MTLNGKRDDFTTEDLLTTAKVAAVKTRAAKDILNQVREALSNWHIFAKQAKVAPKTSQAIAEHFRLS